MSIGRRVILAELYRPRHVKDMVGNTYARYAYILWLGGTIGLRFNKMNGKGALKYAKNLFKKIFGKDIDNVLAKSRSKNRKEIIGEILKRIEDENLPATALLIGPPGVGKTTLVYASANDIGRNVYELNASDFRTSEAIRKYVLSALTTPQVDPLTLRTKDHIVFLDEIDGLSAIGDSGGASALYRILLRDSKEKFIRYPLVLAANDRSASSVKLIRGLVVQIPFYRPSLSEVVTILKRIFKAELSRRGEEIRRILEERNLPADPESPEIARILNRIALASNGDLRSAIEDLQVFLETGELHQSRKNREFHVAEIVRIIVSDKVTSLSDLRRELMNYDDEPSLFLYWVLENIPNFVKDPTRRAEAYRLLADADLHYERGKRGMRSLWRYVNLLAGFALSYYTENKPKWNPNYLGHIKVSRPEYFQKLNERREEREKLKIAFQKAANRVHISYKKFVEDVVPFLRIIASHKPEKLLGLLDEEAIVLLAKDKNEAKRRLEEYIKAKEEKRKKEKKEKKPSKVASKTSKKSSKASSKSKEKEKKEEKKEKKSGSLDDIIGDLLRAF